MNHMRATPKLFGRTVLFSDSKQVARLVAITRRVSRGSMMPSSQMRAVA